jgi:hypothetical protein
MSSHRSRVVGAGLAFFVPGGSHLYARRPWTSLALAVGWIPCLVVASGKHELASAAGALGLGWLVLADVIFGLRALRSAGRRTRSPSRLRQVARGLGLALGAGILGAALALLGALPEWLARRELSRFEVSCDEGSVSVENQGNEPRTVTLDRVVVQSWPDMLLTAADTASVTLRGPGGLTLAPGERGTFPFELPDSFTALCGVPRSEPSAGVQSRFLIEPPLLQARRHCNLAFDFASAEAQGSRPGVRANGTCSPPWTGGAQARASLRYPPSSGPVNPSPGIAPIE